MTGQYFHLQHLIRRKANKTSCTDFQKHSFINYIHCSECYKLSLQCCHSSDVTTELCYFKRQLSHPTHLFHSTERPPHFADFWSRRLWRSVLLNGWPECYGIFWSSFDMVVAIPASAKNTNGKRNSIKTIFRKAPLIQAPPTTVL